MTTVIMDELVCVRQYFGVGNNMQTMQKIAYRETSVVFGEHFYEIPLEIYCHDKEIIKFQDLSFSL